VYTSTLTHRNGCTRTYTQRFKCCFQQLATDSLSSKSSITTQPMGFTRKFCSIFAEQGWKGPTGGHSIRSLSLERPASSLSLLTSFFITSPWRHPVWEIAQLISAVARVCRCPAPTRMLCEHPGCIPGAAGHGAVLLGWEPLGRAGRVIPGLYSPSLVPEDHVRGGGVVIFVEVASGFQPEHIRLL